MNTIVDVALAVEKSTITGQNKVQLSTDELGTRQVRYFNSSVFLSGFFRTLPNMTMYHHFRASLSQPGIIFFKEFADSEEKQFKLLKDGCDMSKLQQGVHLKSIHPASMQLAILRPFCRSNLAADKTCPKPTVPKPGLDSSSSSTSRKRTVTSSELPETPMRKPVLC